MDKWYGLLLKEGDQFHIPGLVNAQYMYGTEEEKYLLDIQSKYSAAVIDYTRVLLQDPNEGENSIQRNKEITHYREEYEKAKKEIEDIFYW